ncbi:MAG: CARDB domain-containing protein [bacterium]|nr:CARDB domain-containing protein [bacterium]
MHKKFVLFLMSLTIFVLAIAVNAQGISPNPNTPPNPNANISFPPPVYFLRGEMQIYGSANLPGMASYYLEYRPLIIAPSPDVQLPEIPWGPISLPSNVPVQDGLLGIWNTFTVADGLYEIRLTVNITGQDPVEFMVSPLRVENSPTPFALRNIQLFTLPGGLDAAVITPEAPIVPVATESVEVTDTTPTVTSNTDANVRSGDDTVYGRVGVLLTNSSAPVLGISSTGSGWYYIELSNGTRGFISPQVVAVSGDVSNLERISPPPRPVPTATPAPTRAAATQPPTAGADLAGALPALNPSTPSCGVAFTVLINLTNLGSSAVPAGTSFQVTFQDWWNGNLLEADTTTVNLSGPINPGGNFVVGTTSPITVNNGGGQPHELRVVIDSNNNILETNEGNNLVIRTYTLSGGC